MEGVDIKNIVFIIGILSLTSGTVIIAISRGSIFFLEACIMISLGLVLPFLSFMEADRGKQNDKKILKLSIKAYLTIAFLTQLMLAPFFYDMFNFQNWLNAASLFARGANPYQFCYELSIFDMFPYPAMFLYLLIIGREVFQAFGLRIFLLFFKSLLIISNVVTAYLIYKMIVNLKGNLNLAKRATCLFIFNPLLVFVTSIHGEFDPLVILFTMLAVYFLVAKDELALSALSLGIGFSLKLYPLLLLPFFLVHVENLKRRIKFVLFMVAPMLLVSMPFLILNFQAYVNVAFNTGGGSGPFSPWQSGLNEFLVIPVFKLSFTLSLFVAIFGLLLLLRDRDLTTNILLCLIAVYLALPFIHENHITWMLPFVVLGMKKNRVIYLGSLFPFLHIILFTGAFGMAGLPYWLSSWVGSQTASMYSIYNIIDLEVSLILSSLLVISFLGACIYILAKHIYTVLHHKIFSRIKRAKYQSNDISRVETPSLNTH